MNKQKITVDNTASQSTVLFEFILAYLKNNEISADIFDDLRLVVEETFINISRYAYPPDVTKNVDIEIEHSTDSVNITFIDTGYEFNPLTDNTKPIDTENYCEGGMGIHLITSLTDEQSYKRVEQHNVFTVTKHYTK